MKNSQANYLNDRYLSIADVLAAGGVWNKREACYVLLMAPWAISANSRTEARKETGGEIGFFTLLVETNRISTGVIFIPAIIIRLLRRRKT